MPKALATTDTMPVSTMLLTDTMLVSHMLHTDTIMPVSLVMGITSL